VKINQAGIELIKKYEGLSLRPYKCPAGFLTIGYGHVILPHENFVEITESQAESLLLKDIAEYEEYVAKAVNSDININQFGALVSFSYNLGILNLLHSTLLKKVNAGEHMDVPAEFIKWVHIDRKKTKGLIKRRLSEASLYMEY
jgi:lysozyme